MASPRPAVRWNELLGRRLPNAVVCRNGRTVRSQAQR